MIVCSRCNNQLGHDVDGPLASALEPIRHFLSIKSGDRRKPPPTLRAVETEHGKVDVAPGKYPLLSKANLETQPHGELTKITASARSLEEAAKLAAHGLRKAGITSREDAKQRLEARPPTITGERQPFRQQVNVSLAIGGGAHFRSIAKTAFEFLAIVRPGDAHAERFDVTRSYIVSGEPNPRCVRWALDLQPPMPFSLKALGRTPHSVVVWSRAAAPVAGIVTLFGHLRFVVRLAEVWDCEPFGFAHAVDPISGSSLGVVALNPVPPPLLSETLAWRQVDLVALRLAYEQLLAACADEYETQATRKMVDDATAPVFSSWTMGQKIDGRMVDDLAQSLAREYVGWTDGDIGELQNRDTFIDIILREFDKLSEGKH